MVLGAMLLLAVAAPVLATYLRDGPFEWGLASENCTTSGGAEGVGYLEVVPHAKEYDRSGTNYFKMLFERQYKSEDGSWVTDVVKQKRSKSFSDDLKDHVYEPKGQFSFTLSDAIFGTQIRIRVQTSWYDERDGKDARLARKAVAGAPCTTTITPPPG